MTGFSLAPIHHQLFLVTPRFPIAVDEVTQTGAAEFDPPLQDLCDGLKKPFPLYYPYGSNFPGRMNSRVEESLIGIDIPDPRHKTLIQ